jgi:predicted choloylglycine hydrolase
LWPDAPRALTEAGRTVAGAARARQRFAAHMPELVPALDLLAGQLDLPHAEAFLTQAELRPFWSGCSQVGGNGTLLRNYDFDPGGVEGVFSRSHLLRPVIGTQDCGWGLLDGMNDAGLAVSLTFGGRFTAGPGFAILIVLRYLLETCETVDQALTRLAPIPIMIPQNVTLVDPGRAVTVYLGPDIPMTVAPDACAANHQHFPLPDGQEQLTRTQQRLTTVRAAGDDVAAMLKPPLYQVRYDEGMGTVYTARYRPAEGRVTYHWPGGETWEQSFSHFAPASRTVTLGTPDAPGSRHGTSASMALACPSSRGGAAPRPPGARSRTPCG